MKKSNESIETELPERIDLRKAPKVIKEQKRLEAIRMPKSGMNRQETARILGVSQWCVSQWYSAYKEEGNKALKVESPDIKEGDGRSLSPEQEAHIRNLLVDILNHQLNTQNML